MASANTSIINIDDTIPLSCTFLATEQEGDHVVYLMKVQRGFDTKYSWEIRKRYNEFNELFNQLKMFNYDLPLPPKKTFGNMKREFLSVRQIGLQEFMDKILANLQLAQSYPVKKFLDQENYTQNYRELAIAHVSMLFRSESNWEIIEPLKEIGWRFKKQHVLLKNSENPTQKYILTWYDHGVDKVLKENELKTIFQQYTQIQHEFIEPIVRLDSFETSTIMIQKFNEKAVSLKDFIRGRTKINTNFMKKYSNQKTPNQTFQMMNLNTIKTICKKILLALQFIYSKGLFYGHLHSGNVLIEGNNVKLTDLPNSLLGLPFYYRSYVIEQRKIQNLELVDVYGLGHILYEMAYGEPLIIASCKKDFNDCSNREIKQILDLLLNEELLKTGLPTVNELLENPFFKNINVDQLSTSSVSAAATTLQTNTKLFNSAKVKELIIKARECVERRINDEQKFLFKTKRQSQNEAKVLSEEEIRKRRKEKKKAEKDLINNSLEFPALLLENNCDLFIALSNSMKINTNVSHIGNGSLSSSIKSDSNLSCDTLSIPESPSVYLTPKTPITPSTPKSATQFSPPPPPPPPSHSSSNRNSAPPPPPPPPALNSAPSSNPDRSQLLNSIAGFSKQGLKKAVTNDRSKPKV